MTEEVTQWGKINLTDEEWMSLIDKERDGLPMCCANISALRDAIIEIARNDCEIGPLEAHGLFRAYRWCEAGHDMEAFPTVQKLIRQVETATSNQLANFPQVPEDLKIRLEFAGCSHRDERTLSALADAVLGLVRENDDLRRALDTTKED